jgi:hypothetical protein
MTEQQAAPTPATKKAPRAGENRYPNYDLNACIALAKKVKDEGGNDCTVEQLGALLGYKNTNGGGFATRVGNAKMFGLIETVQGRYRITARAETIMYPFIEADREQALVDAFLSVPMYKRVYEMHKNQRLPEALGMQNLLHRQFQIPHGERMTMALRVLMDSADQAGFFKTTKGSRTNLVLPIISRPAPTGEGDGSREQAAPPFERNGGGGTGGGGGGGPTDGLPSRGKLLDGMWEELPSDSQWDEDQLAFWLETFERLLRVHYKSPKPQDGKR